jgi:shikimate dehydrogenase
MKIDAHTLLTGLYGHPVEHSFSPAFMNRVFTILNINSRYIAFDVKQECIEDAFHSIRALGLRGVNITIPFKGKAASFADVLSEDALSIGAVNCLVNKNGKLIGHNTDHIGFIKPMERRKISIAGCSALLLGCGGAARSVLYALTQKEVKKVFLVNRTEKNATRFIQWSKKILGFNEIIYVGNQDALTQNQVNETGIIINTTPVGMHPFSDESPFPKNLACKKHHVVYDLIYNPANTLLLKGAIEKGARTINGFEMLILQGLYSCILWFPEKETEILNVEETILDYARKQVKHEN